MGWKNTASDIWSNTDSDSWFGVGFFNGNKWENTSNDQWENTLRNIWRTSETDSRPATNTAIDSLMMGDSASWEYVGDGAFTEYRLRVNTNQGIT
jgi:hypothetical protein